MTAYFDALGRELTDLVRSNAGFEEYLAFDKRLVRDIGLDVQMAYSDPAYNFPDDLKIRVYRLFWKYSFAVNETLDETERWPQSRMLRQLVGDLHDIYHERAFRDHPFGDGVGTGVTHILDQFRDAAALEGA